MFFIRFALVAEGPKPLSPKDCLALALRLFQGSPFTPLLLSNLLSIRSTCLACLYRCVTKLSERFRVVFASASTYFNLKSSKLTKCSIARAIYKIKTCLVRSPSTEGEMLLRLTLLDNFDL